MEANYNRIMGIEKSKRRAKCMAITLGKMNMVVQKEDSNKDNGEEEGASNSEEETGSEEEDEEEESEQEEEDTPKTGEKAQDVKT